MLPISVLVALSLPVPVTSQSLTGTRLPSACAPGIVDQAAPGNCLSASSTPVQGLLYPLSHDLFVAPSGYVGIGTTSPQARADVRQMALSSHVPALRVSQHSDNYFPNQTALEVVGGVTDVTPRRFRIYTDSNDPYTLKAQMEGKFRVSGTAFVQQYAGAGLEPALRVQQHSNAAAPNQTVLEAVGGVTDVTPKYFRVYTDAGDPWNLKLRMDGPILAESATLDHALSAATVEIRGGGDVVEKFSSSEAVLEAGTVVVLDPCAPGKIKASAGSYDKKVIGVVSGAGGVRPGLSLSQTDVLDGDVQVAMVGRVYLKCSAENGPIEAGDRLTTASLPGHAMKATDRDLSDGAVIGKAAGSLAAGTGLILVVVNLQ